MQPVELVVGMVEPHELASVEPVLQLMAWVQLLTAALQASAPWMAMASALVLACPAALLPSRHGAGPADADWHAGPAQGGPPDQSADRGPASPWLAA